VVLRRQDGRPVEVALIHRPAYDDWTLPKGKLNPGETHEEAALREVKEETGLVCRLGDPAGQVEYRDRKGRPKVVRYWTMEPVGTTGGEFVPNDEVDRLGRASGVAGSPVRAGENVRPGNIGRQRIADLLLVERACAFDRREWFANRGGLAPAHVNFVGRPPFAGALSDGLTDYF